MFNYLFGFFPFIAKIDTCVTNTHHVCITNPRRDGSRLTLAWGAKAAAEPARAKARASFMVG